LIAVFLLNISNYAHWVAFPAVNKVAAEYYDQPGWKMDWIPTLSYGLGVPCGLLATYVVERYGLKHGIQIGGSLTGIGGLMCFLSSMPHLADNLSNESKFNLALIGQALTGVACPFIACVPTKISQHWFADEQRSIATTVLGMAGSVGCILGQGITPLMVYQPTDIFLMNTVWFIPAAIGSVLTMWKVRSNYPPHPPSPSAAMIPKAKNLSEWMTSIRTIFSNRAFIVIFLFLGACMGCVSSVMTKIEQIMCSRGYSDQLSGLAGAMILTCAAVASIPIGLLAYKNAGRSSLICKAFVGVGLLGVVGNAYFMRLPGHGAYIVASCIVMGGFAVGAYAVALELVVECTYPVDQATSTAFIFLSSALQGVILMFLENVLSGPLDAEAIKIQVCTKTGSEGDDGHGHQEARDYSSYLNFLAIFVWSIFALFAFCFQTEMKRSNADKLHRSQMSSSSSCEDRKSSIEESPIIRIKKDEENNIKLLDSNTVFLPPSSISLDVESKGTAAAASNGISKSSEENA